MMKNNLTLKGIPALVGSMMLATAVVVLSSYSTGPDKAAAPTTRIDTVASGLKTPWAMAFLPSGEMLVTERGGTLRLVKDGKLDPTPIKGMPEVFAKGQGGLLDVVLHPNYKSNGWIYISFSSPAKEGEEGTGANTALLRARLKNHELVDQKIIFKAVPNVTSNVHYGGRIAFDKSGLLFLTLGERGQKEKAQDPTNHMGTVVRLNDDGSVPKDNPFVGKTTGRPEIYSYGHRNPQGLAMNPATGVMWAHEHGPQGGDELNIVKKGVNYGWPSITYGIDYDNSIISKDTARAEMEQPVIFWRPSIAPCGMTFVTSKKFKEWNGDLLVGSMKFGYIAHIVIKGDKVVSQEKVFEKIGRVRDLREGPDGNLYVVVESAGAVVRISPINQ
jgi:aldose sugar dehydrogenase